MTLRWLLVVSLIVLGCSRQECQPFGLRLFYGDQIIRDDSTEKLSVYFNTAENCSRSYIQAITPSTFEKVYSVVTYLNLTGKNGTYQTYIHKCSLSKTPYEKELLYNAFGANEDPLFKPVPFSNSYTETFIADPTNALRTMKVIVLADWGPIQVKKYIPIIQEVKAIAETKTVHAVIVIGDLGYDLDTNNCANYEKYNTLLSEATSAAIPIIHITGNHEYNTANNLRLYQESFKLYSLDTALAVGIPLGSIYLASFDPYALIYKKNQLRQDSTLLGTFQEVLRKGQASKRRIITTSHYPLACSGSSPYCQSIRTTLKGFFDAMFDVKVNLYLGAHEHTFQRIKPYLRNGSFVQMANDYKLGDEYLVSIVEGVAGNDKGIVEQIDNVLPITISLTANETGFGVLTNAVDGLTYEHYSSANGLHLVDTLRMSTDMENVK